MLRFFGNIIGLIIAVGGGLFAFGMAREFVRNKLRFVDGVQNPAVPWVVGAVCIAAAGIITGILPLHIIGFGTAIVVGGAAGLGTASGVKALKRGE